MAANETHANDPSDEREDRLLSIVRAYTQAVDAGEKPDRRALMRRHPELAAELSACLGGLTFLNHAAGELAAVAHDLADATAAGPQLLGDYRLLREIGRGGMGVVYEAEQISLGRRVAVKVLPMAAALDKRQLQRFRNEAQAAAQLHHTHIVPVYAVGCERSTHFYAMQLIDGQSLADVIADLKDAAERVGPRSSSHAVEASNDGSPSAGLSSLREAKRDAFYQSVARLGLQAADALHHAHHSGIVHRDIKPANLLLDNEAALWITDFGLAQFYAAENNLTQSSDRPGTLRYMSPEQAGGSAVVLDQRTDVYSLGVTLYELLTLEKAVPGETREQLLHHLQNQDLRPARALDASVPKELETILITACARDPADRYATAGALAEDLRRFLNDQPILAKPPPLTQRLGRWVRRHRAATLTAAVTGMLLLGGSVVSTVLIAREQSKTRLAYFNERDRAAEAVRERLRAQRSFAEAREAVDYFAQIAANELADQRMAPDVQREMLLAAADYYAAFLQDSRADTSQTIALEKARSQLSAVLDELATVEEVYRLRLLVRLLADAAVARDIGLTDQQSVAADTLARDLAVGGIDSAFPHSPPGVRPTTGQRERLIDLGTRIKSRLDALLGPPQLDRLRQIARQVRGPTAFFDPDVSRMLGLSVEQKERVRSILVAARAETRRPRTVGERTAATNRSVADSAGDTPRARAVQKLAEVLDAPQKVVWQTLVGKPVEGIERLDPDSRDLSGNQRFDPARRGHGGPRGSDRPPPPDDGEPDGWH